MKKLRLAVLLALAFAAPVFAQPRPAPARAAPPAMAAPPVAGAQPLPAGAQPLVDVNSADAGALDALPGIGPARAKAIIAGRPYAEKADLVTRKVLSAAVLKGIADRIALVNVNAASAADMARILPNVGSARAAAIVKARPYATPQDLVAKGALTQGVLDGIKGLVTAN